MSETRKLVTVRAINDIQPIPGADMIVVATVDGWKVVVKNGEFKVGDPCIYFEIDSFLPEGDYPWKFLVDKSSQKLNSNIGHKLRTIRLKGQVSQGFVLPISALPVVQYVIGEELDTANSVFSSMSTDQRAIAQKLMDEVESGVAVRGLDFSELLGVVKYEPPLPAELVGQALGLFPSFIPKTDQERCQNIRQQIFGYESSESDFNYENLTQEALNKGVEEGRMKQVQDGDTVKYVLLHKAGADVNARYEVSMKLDGSSMTAFVQNQDEQNTGVMAHKIGVCSRNLELKINEENAGNTFVKVLNESGLYNALENFYLEFGRSIAVQGELMGPGIQGNRESFAKHVFYVFDIFDIDQQRKLAPAERLEIFNALKVSAPGITHAPILDAAFNLRENGIETIDDLLKFAEGPSINHKIREGLVFKRLDGNFSFKGISNLFLMKEV